MLGLIVYFIGSIIALALFIWDQCISVGHFEYKQLFFALLQLIGSWACVIINIANIIVEYRE